MVEKWICLDIANRYCRKTFFTELCQKIELLFDGAKVLVIGDHLDENHLENYFFSYVFVQCNDIAPFRKRIFQSRYINSVLYSLENPTYISTEDIQVMIDEWNKKKKKEKNMLQYGDIVQVRSGTFKDLYGIVVDRVDSDNFKILFKFYKNYQIMQIHCRNCKQENNLFNYIRIPVNV